MPPDVQLQPGAIGGALASLLAHTQRQLTLARQEHGEALDLLNRACRCCEAWFERPCDEPLYRDICTYLDVPMVEGGNGLQGNHIGNQNGSH